MRLGYLLSLHDNYQDIYRDSPSWNEDLIMKKPDGSLARRWGMDGGPSLPDLLANGPGVGRASAEFARGEGLDGSEFLLH